MSPVIARLNGVFPVLPTPLMQDESLDLVSLGSLIDRLLAAGIRGLTLLGSSAESNYMTLEERRAVLKAAAEQVAGRATLLVGLIAFGTRAAVEEAKSLRDIGADALLVALPQYYRTPLGEVITHYRTLVDELKIPILYYHYPEPTHLRLTPAQVSKLFSEVELAGIKNSSLDTSDTLAQIKAIGRPIQMFTGSSFDALVCLNGGAVGSICPVATLMPKTALRLVELQRAGDLSGAQQQQNRFYTALPLVMPESVDDGPPVGVPHAGVKEALHSLGLIRSARVRDPQPVPSEARRAQIRELAPSLVEL